MAASSASKAENSGVILLSVLAEYDVCSLSTNARRSPPSGMEAALGIDLVVVPLSSLLPFSLDILFYPSLAS